MPNILVFLDSQALSKPVHTPSNLQFFCPMEALTAERGDEYPEMRALMSRATAAANLMRLP
jgi:hypothetical protein